MRRKPRDGAASDVGERQSGDAANRREQQALDQHLPQDACAPGAEREPHAHLPLPPRAARQHQRGDVGAGEQQDETEKDHQHRDGRGEDLLLREQAAAAVAQHQRRHGIAGADRHDRADNRDELRVERRLRRAIAHTRFRAARTMRPRPPDPRASSGRWRRASRASPSPA